MPPKKVPRADNMRLGMVLKSPQILNRLSKDEEACKDLAFFEKQLQNTSQ